MLYRMCEAGADGWVNDLTGICNRSVAKQMTTHNAPGAVIQNGNWRAGGLSAVKTASVRYCRTCLTVNALTPISRDLSGPATPASMQRRAQTISSAQAGSSRPLAGLTEIAGSQHTMHAPSETSVIHWQGGVPSKQMHGVLGLTYNGPGRR